MSAPDGDLNRQAKHHRGPLRGMFAVVLFALVMLAILAFWAFGRGGTPQGAETQVQTGTGVIEEVEDDEAVSANVTVEEREEEAATATEADPTAVEVPSLQVEHPQTGTEDTVNPLVAPSETAVPLDPVSEEEGGEGPVTD